MRLALLSDVHGNLLALDAVLADLDTQGGTDGYMVLGDLAAIGSDPVAVLERLANLPGVRFVQGNTDRYLVTGERPCPHVDDALADPALVPRLVEVAASFAWTQGALTPGDWLDWLAALPSELRLRLPDGTRLLATHVAPGQDDGAGIHPAMPDNELTALLEDCGADLVCVGHTHWPLDKPLGARRMVNVGSVSNPWAPDPRASYVLLEADNHGYQIAFRRVAYDQQAAIAAVRRSRHPAGDFIVDWLQGRRQPWWANAAGRAWVGPAVSGRLERRARDS